MKKNVLLLLALSVITISCGGKNGEKNGEKAEANEEVVADCGCSELQEGKLNGKLYTGNCADKDQKDTITLKMGFKNGIKISEMTKQKVNGKYIVTKNVTYDDGKENDGFKLTLSSNNDDTYTGSYYDYKDGKEMNYYDVYLSNDDALGNSIHASWITKNGKHLYKPGNRMTEESRPNCMPDAELSTDADSWKLYNVDKSVFDKVVSDLQKEFPKFYYVK